MCREDPATRQRGRMPGQSGGDVFVGQAMKAVAAHARGFQRPG